MSAIDVGAAAANVASVAATHSPESETQRRLAPQVADAIRASGLNRLVLPSALGGTAADPRMVVEAVETIAYTDASAAWCAGISMGSNFLSGLVSEEASQSLFTDPDAGGAGPFAPAGRAEAVDGGFQVTGRWPFSSNCHQARVIGAGIMTFADGRPAEIGPDGRPVARLGFFTADQLQIDETWDTVGMRGTGSHDLIATDVHLPAERVFTLFDPAWPDDALFRLRAFDVLGPCLAPVPLGIGRAALDVVSAKAVTDAAGPPAKGPRPRFIDDPVAQIDFGKADTRLRAARALLIEALGTSYEVAEKGSTPPRHMSAVIGLACSEALRAGAHAVDTAVRISGSSSVRQGSPLERLRRDIDTAGSHIMFAPTIMAGLVKEVSGIPSPAYPFLPPPPS